MCFSGLGMFPISHIKWVKFGCHRAGSPPCSPALYPALPQSPVSYNAPVPHTKLFAKNRSSLGLVKWFSDSLLGSIAVVLGMHMAHCPQWLIVLSDFTVISSILVATTTVFLVYLFVGCQWLAAGNHSEIAHCSYDFVKDM